MRWWASLISTRQLWTIPAARIQTGRKKSGDHALPLTAPMLDLIEGIKTGRRGCSRLVAATARHIGNLAR